MRGSEDSKGLEGRERLRYKELRIAYERLLEKVKRLEKEQKAQSDAFLNQLRSMENRLWALEERLDPTDVPETHPAAKVSL